MGSPVLPRLLFAGACIGLCVAAVGCTSSPVGTAGGVVSTAVPAVGGSPTATGALGASAGTSTSTGVPSVPHYKNLPTGWKTFSSWNAKLVTMAGPKATVIDLHDGSEDPGVTVMGRDWTAPGSPDLSFSVAEDENRIPIAIDCSADKYNPADAGADSAIEELFRQCVSAEFPGTDTTAAEQWMLGNLANFLQHQRKAPHASAGTSIKEFGDGRYGMGTGYIPAYGLDVSIHIAGLEVR